MPNVFPGTSIQSVVDANPAGTTYTLKTGTHVQQTVIPKTGDTFVGETGTILDGQNTAQFAFKGWNGSSWVNNVTLRGFTITQYNPPTQNGAVWGGDDVANATSGWLLDTIEASYCSHYGVRIGNGMRVLNSNLHHNGTINIGGIGNNVIVDGTEVAYGNYLLANDPGFESGGSKFVRTDYLIVRNSWFHHNGGVGLWLDINNIHYLLESNRIEDNVREGIVAEISYTGVIRYNQVRRNGYTTDPYRTQNWLWDAGIAVHASSDVEIYGNMVTDNFNGIVAIQQARGAAYGDPAEVFGPYVVQNLYVHDNTIVQNITQGAGLTNAAAGIVEDNGDTTVFTGRNNRFQNNAYYLIPPGGGQSPGFEWQGWQTAAQWQAVGNDTAGTFNYTAYMASPYINLATDGTDLGANIATITALTSVASSGDRRSVTETRYSGGWFTYNGVNRVQYPRTLLDTDTFPTRTGSVINVNTDAGFRAALTTAQPGDWIVVDNTVTYTGNYYGAFPVKAGDATPGGNNVIVVISKAIYDGYSGGTFSVCPQKKRIAPTDLASLAFFKTTNSLGAFMVTGATKGWRFVGLRFEPDTSVSTVSHLVSAGNPDNALQNSASQCPSNIGFDRCYFDGHATAEIRHATELHCKSGFIVDSYYGDNLHVTSFTDSQCLTMYNGPGPFRIVNNRVCGQIENVIIGGSTSSCGMPADIEFRYNYFTRPTSSKGVWGTKCSFEIKKTQFCLVEGNIIENCWKDRQIGAGLLLKSESYGDGAIIGFTSDVLVRYNLIRNVAAAVTFATQSPPTGGTEAAQPINRAISYSNLYRVGGGIFDASQNPLIGMYTSTNCGSIHDTFIADGSILSIGVPTPTVCAGFILSDTIFPPTTYGLKGGATSEGTATIALITGAGGTVSKDVFTGRSSGDYPAGHYFPADVAAIQYTNTAANDFSLLGTGQTGGGTVTPVASRLKILTQPSGGASGSALPTQPVVQILDQFGNVFSSTATITATSDSGSVSDAGNTTAAVAGVATFTALTPTAASTTDTTWTFSASGLPSITSSNTTVTVAVASRVASALRIVTQPAGSVSGVALTQQPSVEVIDQYGDRITSTATITANVVSAGPVSFTAGTTAVASAGLATFTTLTAVTTAEYHAAVNFTASGLTSVQSNYFVVTVVAVPVPDPVPEEPPPSEPPITVTSDPVPSSLVVTREPGPAGKLYSRKKFPIQPIVEAHDETGALMTTFSGNLTAYLGDGQAGTLIGGVTVAAVGGIGRWVNLGVSGTTGPVEISFIDGPYDGSV